MKKEIADKWVAALPRFTQAKGWLHPRAGHCCLGVLCEVAIEEGVALPKITENNTTSYDGQTKGLPYSIMQWAGLRTDTGRLISNSDGMIISLAGMNDHDSTFEDIAQVIRERWEEL